MSNAVDVQTQWARLLLRGLVQVGVCDAVISPGSRSTPFVLAALHTTGLRGTSAIDERSAAHFALGQARATGRPSLLICTSGSAPANYFPAVIEAAEDGVPLIILSADRPPELQGCGSNQTTDQLRFFGSRARFFANLGEPRADRRSLRALRRVAGQAFAYSISPTPGPVHLNAQARKPLEPHAEDRPDALQLAADAEELASAPITTIYPVSGVHSEAIEQAREAFAASRRPMILCGPLPPRFAESAAEPLRRLARRTHAVLAAEASSQFRFGEIPAEEVVGAFDALWRSERWREPLRPDFVLQVGGNPVSPGWASLCADSPIRRIVVHPWKWTDAQSGAEAIVHGDPGAFLAALAELEHNGAGGDGDFAKRFTEADVLAWRAVAEVSAPISGLLTEGSVTRTVAKLVPEGSALVLGNSLPIRDVDAWAPPSAKRLRVFAQRGVSGIDGAVSAAAGSASRLSSETTLLVGDVSFLHDINGLELAAATEGPLVIVVANNRGGKIFEQLPIAAQATAEQLRYFTTPHDADLAAAAAVHRCGFERAKTVVELDERLQTAYASEGCTVVEAVISGSPVEEYRALWLRLQTAIGG